MNGPEARTTAIVNCRIPSVLPPDSSGTIIMRGGRIAEVHPGNAPDLGNGVTVHDARGATAVPGFIETHGHPLTAARGRSEITFETIRSADALISEIRSRARQSDPDDWIIGRGWDESLLGIYLTAEVLDRADVPNPVYIKRRCGHIGTADSEAMRRCGITGDTPNPPGGEIRRDPRTGAPDGVLLEQAQSLITHPDLPADAVTRGLLDVGRELLDLGVTTCHDMASTVEDLAIANRSASDSADVPRWRLWPVAFDSMNRRGCLDQLVDRGITSGFGDDHVQVSGVKIFLDGSLGSQTASVTQCYCGQPDNLGIQYMDADELRDRVRRSGEAGFDVAVHAIGDRAIRDAVEVLSDQRPARRHHRIEHFSMPDRTLMEKMVASPILPSVSNAFLHVLGDSYFPLLETERIDALFPLRTMIDLGIRFALNSDFPVTPVDPYICIATATRRTSAAGGSFGTAESVARDTAVRAMTEWAAAFSAEADVLGRIAPGYHADINLFTEPIDRISDDALVDVRPQATFLAGRQVR